VNATGALTRCGPATPAESGEPETEVTATSLPEVLNDGRHQRRAALSIRISALVGVLGGLVDGGEAADLLAALDRVLGLAGPDEIWLALAVVTGQLPDSAAVLRATRSTRLDGAASMLFDALAESGQLCSDDWPDVDVVSGRVVVDINHTARTSLTTGIQRVARETVRRWRRDKDVMLIGWTDDYAALRELAANEVDYAFVGPGGSSDDPGVGASRVIVPWRCTVLVPELPAEPVRAPRFQAFANYSGSTTGLIGFDCVPVMAAETSAEGMSSGFASYLGAAAHVNRIAAISETAAIEYRGWRTMLAGVDLSGPDIRRISLPVEARTPSDRAMQEARQLLSVGPLPIVLAVGSHEPRKNHLALVHGAEVLWREGMKFTLAFIGGNAWNSEHFTARVQAMQEANRPIQMITALPDELLWAAYRLAYCTVFPSLHEGFGLPVAESLASGTPVITSNFGSMREIAQHGGAILVDPRRDDEVTDALRRLLSDEALRERLAGEASNLPLRTWDEYAAETWSYLVEGLPAGQRT
jgi:glycosyltransferase involved in cell wall biosynthesis